MRRKFIASIILFSAVFALSIFIFPRGFAAAAFPVIFYSDLDSGPKTGGQDNKGAFVTIWGKNFGAMRGSSYVSIGGGQADNYPVWTDTKITFQLGANVTTGNIAVTTSEGTSNGVFFTVRSGNIYFVKTTGSDTTGDGSWSNPWRTIIKAKNTIAPGDIAYIGDGVSQATEDENSAYVNLNSHGTATNPKALVAYPSATVNIGGDTLSRGFHNWVSGGAGGYRAKYWVISQFKIRTAGIAVPVGVGYRIIGNDITAPNGDGATAAVEGNGSGAKILGNELHNVGKSQPSKLYHNIYIDNNDSGTTSSDIEIGWNIIRNSTANRAIQFYAGNSDGYISDVAIHDNLIYEVRGNGININNHTTGTFKIYNNIIYKAGTGPGFYDGETIYSGVYIASNNTTLYLYNNTIYDCGYASGATDSGLLYINNYTGTIYPRSNVFYSNGANYENYMAPDSSNPPNEAYKNLFYGKGSAPSWDTASINQDPRFVNIASYDFHLQTSSPAKDTGVDASAIATNDYDGVLRPQGGAFDIGAYEYISQTFHPADTNQNNKIEMGELMSFIGRWKTSQATLADVLDIMGRWMRGE